MKISSKDDIFKIRIERPESGVLTRIKENWDRIAKPLDALGDFETLVCRIGAMQGSVRPDVSRRCAVIFCADNGVVEEGVSQSGKEVTLQVARALGGGISSACTLGRKAGVKILPVDIGIDFPGAVEGVRDLKVRRGTRNFLKEPAMSDREVVAAFGCGVRLAGELSREGFDVIALGEMGIGNTTTATAVLSAALGVNSDSLVGRGAGLDDAGLLRKKEVIAVGLALYRFEEIRDEREKAYQILRCVGGLDMAGLAGLAVGSALLHMPVVLDGVISSASALIASRLVPGVEEYFVASHRGREAGNALALRALGLTPFLEGDMALGEGTGAIMLFPVLDLVMEYYCNGAGFGDYGMDGYLRFS